MPAIGIDLGTTNCCVAVVENGKPVVIPNDVGGRTTSSVVSIREGQIKVGEQAKGDCLRFPENVFYGIKHIIGRKHDDPYVLEKLEEYNFNAFIEDKKISLKCDNKTYIPEQISGNLLRNLRDSAEKYLNETVKKAVITVPTHFSDTQRQATIDAGKIAGFEEVLIIDEPTAAAIAYGVDNEYKDGRTVLVYDFGGGTFDVSVINFKNNEYKSLAIDGDLKMGGDHVDDVLYKHFLDILKQQNVDISKDKRKQIRLRSMAESAKKNLSEKVSTTVELYMFMDSEEFEYELTRATFNELIDDYLEKTIKILDRCLQRKGLNKSDIQSVLLVGGSTRIKSVVEKLEKYIGVSVMANINPDEAVALGASIYASKGSGQAYDDLKIDVICSYSIGVKVRGNKMSFIIPQYSEIPQKYVKEYSTVPKGNPTAKISLYSGEKKLATENTLLGNLVVGNIVNGPRGTVVTVTLEINENGVLTASAVDSDGNSNHLKLTLDKGCLTEAEIEEFIEVSETEMNTSKKIEAEQNVTPVKEDTDISKKQEEVAASDDPIPIPPPPPSQEDNQRPLSSMNFQEEIKAHRKD